MATTSEYFPFHHNQFLCREAVGSEMVHSNLCNWMEQIIGMFDACSLSIDILIYKSVLSESNYAAGLLRETLGTMRNTWESFNQLLYSKSRLKSLTVFFEVPQRHQPVRNREYLYIQLSHAKPFLGDVHHISVWEELVQGGQGRHPSPGEVPFGISIVTLSILERKRQGDVWSLALGSHDGNSASTFCVYLSTRDNRFSREARSWRSWRSFLINGKWSVSWCW